MKLFQVGSLVRTRRKKESFPWKNLRTRRDARCRECNPEHQLRYQPNSAKGAASVFLLIAVLSMAGMLLSAVSLQRHYAKSASSFCDLSEKFNHGIVNVSEYSSKSWAYP